MKKDNMDAHSSEGGLKHEPLLLHVSDTGLQSHSQAWPLRKAIIYAIVSLLVISAFLLAFSGLMGGKNEGQSLHNRNYPSKGYLDLGGPFLPGYGSETNTQNWACLCEVVHSRLTTFHHKINALALSHANEYHLANYVAEWVKVFTTLSSEKHQRVDGSEAPKNVEMPSSGTHVSSRNSAASKRRPTGAKRRSHTVRSDKMVSFIKIINELSGEGLLQSHHRILCLDTGGNQKLQALKKRGFNNAERLDVSAAPKVANQELQNTLLETVEDQSFDFAFSTIFDQVSKPAQFVAEIERVLKVGGYAAMHVSLNAWRNKFIKGKPGDGAKPVTLLFKTSKIVYVSAAYAPGLDTIIVFKKVSYIGKMRYTQETKGADQAEKVEKQVSDHQPAVDLTDSIVKYDCRKCIKEQDAMFAPTAMQ